MKALILCSLAGALATSMAFGASSALLSDYRAAGAGPFSSATGRSAWLQGYPSPDGSDQRSCASCHGSDLRQPGKHVKTGRSIEPMALSVNARRLTDARKTEKWFRRNCRWTLGRECTPQEKGDFLQFIISH